MASFTAAELANLRTARANFIAKLAEVSANPKPNYTVGNQSISWADYYRMLDEKIKDLEELIRLAEDGAWDVRSIGRAA